MFGLRGPTSVRKATAALLAGGSIALPLSVSAHELSADLAPVRMDAAQATQQAGDVAASGFVVAQHVVVNSGNYASAANFSGLLINYTKVDVDAPVAVIPTTGYQTLKAVLTKAVLTPEHG